MSFCALVQFSSLRDFWLLWIVRLLFPVDFLLVFLGVSYWERGGALLFLSQRSTKIDIICMVYQYGFALFLSCRRDDRCFTILHLIRRRTTYARDDSRYRTPSRKIKAVDVVGLSLQYVVFGALPLCNLCTVLFFEVNFVWYIFVFQLELP